MIVPVGARPPADGRVRRRDRRVIAPGSFANPGIGVPTKIADHLPRDGGVVLHTENGMLGMGPRAAGDEIDADVTNAGKVPVSPAPRTVTTPTRSR